MEKIACMEKYELYYFDSLIANISIIDNSVLYVPIMENIQQFETQILVDLKTEKNTNIEHFPFLCTRINNMKKFQLNVLKYVTDNYTIKKIL